MTDTVITNENEPTEVETTSSETTVEETSVNKEAEHDADVAPDVVPADEHKSVDTAGDVEAPAASEL